MIIASNSTHQSLSVVLTMEVKTCIIPEEKQSKRFPIVPIGLYSRRLLLRYLARRPSCVQTHAVFLKSDLTPITDDTLRMMFRRLKNKAGIPRLRAHLLRHTFATHYLENGGDIYTLQTILGHTSLEMVKRYVHFTPGKLESNYMKFSPLDNLGGRKTKTPQRLA